jgi:hypothetical protein
MKNKNNKNNILIPLSRKILSLVISLKKAESRGRNLIEVISGMFSSYLQTLTISDSFIPNECNTHGGTFTHSSLIAQSIRTLT